MRLNLKRKIFYLHPLATAIKHQMWLQFTVNDIVSMYRLLYGFKSEIKIIIIIENNNNNFLLGTNTK